jgi:putative transposase
MEIYHVLNRGVDKRIIFNEKKDYMRFIHNLYELNDEESVPLNFYKFRQTLNNKIKNKKEIKNKLVDVLAFCLMPNHYHLLISPRSDNAISKFMHKINMGYSQYFNKKNERTGALFQGKYKKILANDNVYFLYLPFYIHFNPLDLKYPEWRDNKISKPSEVLEYLKSYKWSSHLDYLGINNFPLILNKEPLMEIFGSTKGYKKLVETYLKDIQVINEDVFLE